MDYVYIFKSIAKSKLNREYKQTNDKISYLDIKELTDKYSIFTRKLLSIILTDEELDFKEIKNYLNSDNVLDRLRGLKLSKKYIKLVGDK